jgi:hypothetical protein
MRTTSAERMRALRARRRRAKRRLMHRPPTPQDQGAQMDHGPDGAQKVSPCAGTRVRVTRHSSSRVSTAVDTVSVGDVVEESGGDLMSDGVNS